MNTGITALVFSVILFSMSPASRQYVSGSMSAKIGMALLWITELAVEKNVNAGTMTSSPVPIPAAARDVCNAAVPLFVATAYLVPIYSANFSSNS